MACKKFSVWCFVALLLCACGGSDGDPDPVGNEGDLNRKAMLTHWADNIIIPSYTIFKTDFDVMIEKSEAFVAEPDENSLAAFRDAWVEAYIAWQKVELFEVGPGDRRTIRSFFNIYPADVAGITENMNNTGSNLALPASYARQGFPALDYFLNGLADSDEEILVYYTTDPDAAKRLAYIKRLTDRMNSLLTTVITEWAAYREDFTTKTGTDIGSPTAEMVNAYVLHYERFIRSGKFGIPSGAMATSGGAKHPEKVEAVYKRDISKILAKTSHQAAMDFFNGKNALTDGSGPSFKTYLDGLDAKDSDTGTLLTVIVNEQFGKAMTKLDLLSDNFYQEVETDNQAMIDVYTEMQKAVRMLKVDMTSSMSVVITYTDNDGD